MTVDPQALLALTPEIFLLTAASIILVIDLFLKRHNRELTYGLSIAALLITAALVYWVSSAESQAFFSNSFIRDPLADALKIALTLVGAVSFVYAKDYLVDREIYRGEFFILGMFAILGMMVMVSAGGFLTAYLGLELLALCLYAIVAFDRDSSAGAEAAMKYFVLGALSSGMLLYGISMLYGATGHIDFVGFAEALPNADNTILVFGLVFVVIGIGFKFGAVPFHMWVPDVYHGAPTAATLFLGAAPKIAAFGFAMRLLVDAMQGVHAGWEGWQGMLIVLAILSMGLGNLVAIAQTNLKRMLAYSTISHVGFIMLGLLAGTDEGYSAAMFYAVTYAFTAAAGFGVLLLLSGKGVDAQELDDLKGLNDRSPWLAGMMLLVMFSMAGVPPTVGFLAKLFVLDAVIGVDLVWVALIGVFFSVIGAFYYLRVIKVMYFDKQEGESAPLVIGMSNQLMMSANGAALLVLGIFPAALFEVCQRAIG